MSAHMQQYIFNGISKDRGLGWQTSEESTTVRVCFCVYMCAYWAFSEIRQMALNINTFPTYFR